MPVRTRAGSRVVFPITFEKGLYEHQEESMLDVGFLAALENWIPEPSGALRARRRWTSGGTSGAPATRRTRGIGSIATQESFATPARRQASFADVINSTSPAGSWSQQTATGNLLLAAVSAKRWPRLVQKAKAQVNESSTCSPTWGAATTTGNLLVAVGVAWAQFSVPSITPPSGWTQVTNNNLGNLRLYMWYRENSVSRSGAETFTLAGSGSTFFAVQIFEYEGMATSGVLDQGVANSGTSNPLQSATTATTTQRDELVICGFGVDATRTFSSPTNGFSIVDATGVNGVVSKVVEATGGQQVGVSVEGSTNFVSLIATFKAALTGPPTITAPGGWTQALTVTRNQMRTSFFYIQNAGSRSGTETFTLTQNSRSDVALLEYTGIVLSSALDLSTSNNGATTTVDSGTTGTTTQAQELVVAALFAGDVAQGAPTNGFSIAGYVASRFTLYEKNVLTTGAQNTSATIGSTRDWIGVIATFKTLQQTSAGNHYLVADDDGANFDVWRTNDIPSGTWAILDANVPASSLDRTSPVVFATGLDRALWTHKDFTKTRSWDGNVANAAADVTNAPRGRAMCFYRERFFIGGTKAGAFGSGGATSNVTRLWFSDVGSYTTWPAGNFIDIGREDGQAIEDIAPVGDGLLVAKRDSLWFVSGTGPDNFHVTELEAGDGYPGRCICVGPHGAMIAGAHHLWMWAGGRPELMSDPVMDSYNIGGSFVSMACVGDTILICDTGSGVVWAHDHMHGTWWRELLPAGNDQPAILHAFEKRLVYGPLASTLVGPLAYRDEPGSARGRDVGLATSYMAETPELYPGGAGQPVTPRHLYLELRQRGGDPADAPLMVTPIYDGVEQTALPVTPQSAARPFRARLDIGSVAGVYGVKFRFEQDNTTTDDAVVDIERVELHALPSPAR